MRGFFGALAGVLAFLVFAGSAQATTCAAGTLAGTWRIVSDGQACRVEIERNGTIFGSCRGRDAGRANGHIAVTRDCKLRGRMNNAALEGRVWSTATQRPNVVLLYIDDATKLYMAYRYNRLWR